MLKSRRLLLALSGARPEILELCPTESVKFESLGWSICITSGLAAVSMWFALSSAIGVSGVVALPPALAWGLVIMGIDRWLITSMSIGARQRLAVAVPRLLLSLAAWCADFHAASAADLPVRDKCSNQRD